MPKHSYKQLEQVYQKGVNKEYKQNERKTHPMSSRQGQPHQEMPTTQTETAQYSQDSQSDSDQDFEATAVRPHAESTRLDGIINLPQDSHAPRSTRPRTDSMDQHGHHGTPSGHQGHYTGHSRNQASQEDEIRHLRGELERARRDTRSMSDDIRELVAGIRDLSSTLIHNSNNTRNTSLNNSGRKHQLSMSILNDIDTYDGKHGHKLDDWLADIENAASIIEEDEVMVAKGKARGIARDLIKELENEPWTHIKEQLRNRLNNESIHTYTSRFMEIQQKDSETLTAYIHRFKKEAKHCDFESHPAKIRIFLKGLVNSSKIAPGVYEKGPKTIEDAISMVEKISSAQRIAASFSQNHQISMMKRNPTDHTQHHDCSNCGKTGHLWFNCPHIICDGYHEHGHIYRHCWNRIPPSGTVSPQEGRHNPGRQQSRPHHMNRRDGWRSRSRSNNRSHPRDRSSSRPRHRSSDSHASRDRYPARRRTPDNRRTQSRSPHRQRSSSRPPTPYPRNSPRSRSSSRSAESSPRRSVTINDSHDDDRDHDYNSEDYFDDDLN